LLVYLDLLQRVEGENLDNAKHDLLVVRDYVQIVRDYVQRDSTSEDLSRDKIIELKRTYYEAYEKTARDDKPQYRKLKEREVKSRELIERELRSRDVKEVKELKKDQSALDATGDVRFFSYSTDSNLSGNVFVIAANDFVDQEGMSWIADTVHYNLESQVLALTRNVELSVGVVLATKGAKLAYVVSPDGEEGLPGYTVIVSADHIDLSADHIDLSDQEDTAGDQIEHDIKVVIETGEVNVVKDKSNVRKRQ